LVEDLRIGRLPSTWPEWTSDGVLSCVILGFVLLIRHNRIKAAQAKALQATLNQAIIHDLKNPMTSIVGCISVLNSEPFDRENQHRLLRLALISCRTQMDLLETLVDTTRMEYGEMTLQKRPIPAKAFVDSCLSDVTGAAEHLGIRIEDSSARPLSEQFVADTDLMRRVVTNLLQNAIKYTPRGGAVSLGAAFSNGNVSLEIHDTGIGIPQGQIGRLFKKYFRVEGGEQSTRRGSGLGLYFCKLVVEAHHGSIDVRSETGSGTTVRILLPVMPRSSGHATEAKRTAGGEAPPDGDRG